MMEMRDNLFGQGDAAPRKEPPILVGALEKFPGVPDEQEPSSTFSALQYSMCPSTLYCCSTSDRIWYEVTINNLSNVIWRKDAMDGLVLPDSTEVDGSRQSTKDILRGLVEAHTKGKLIGTLLDFIENKGQVSSINKSTEQAFSIFELINNGKALIIVLHGPPGVGKTLAAGEILSVQAMRTGGALSC